MEVVELLFGLPAEFLFAPHSMNNCSYVKKPTDREHGPVVDEMYYNVGPEIRHRTNCRVHRGPDQSLAP